MTNIDNLNFGVIQTQEALNKNRFEQLFDTFLHVWNFNPNPRNTWHDGTRVIPEIHYPVDIKKFKQTLDKKILNRLDIALPPAPPVDYYNNFCNVVFIDKQNRFKIDVLVRDHNVSYFIHNTKDGGRFASTRKASLPLLAVLCYFDNEEIILNKLGKQILKNRIKNIQREAKIKRIFSTRSGTF